MGGTTYSYKYFKTIPNTTFFFYSKEEETEVISEDGSSKEVHDMSGI